MGGGSLKGSLTVLLAWEEGAIAGVSFQSTRCPFSVLSGALCEPGLSKPSPTVTSSEIHWCWIRRTVSGLTTDLLASWVWNTFLPKGVRNNLCVPLRHGREWGSLIKCTGPQFFCFFQQRSKLASVWSVTRLRRANHPSFALCTTPWLSHFTFKITGLSLL